MTAKKTAQAKARTRARAGANAKRKGNMRARPKAQAGRVRAPASANTSSSQRGRNSTHFRESERLATVTAGTLFGIVQTVNCNPGLAASFPWLAGHAHLYDRYRIHKLHYRYKNLVGTSTNGNILMGFDYDAKHAEPKSAIEMTQLTKWIDGAPWRIIDFHVPTTGCDYYIRNGDLEAPYDIKTYDMGNMFVAGEGFADVTAAGYLEVIYHIELFDKAPSTETTAIIPVDPGIPVTPGCSPANTMVADICQPNALITCTAVEAGLLEGLVVEQDRGTGVAVSASGLLLPAGVWTAITLNTDPAELTFTATSSAGLSALGLNAPKTYRLHSDSDFGAGTVLLQRRADFVDRPPFPDVSRLVASGWQAVRITGSNSRFYAPSQSVPVLALGANEIPIALRTSSRTYIKDTSARTTPLYCFTLPMGTYDFSATGTIGGVSAMLILNTVSDVFTPIGEQIVVTSATDTYTIASYTSAAVGGWVLGSITLTVARPLAKNGARQTLEQRLCALLRDDDPEFESAEDAANHAYHVRVLNDFLAHESTRVCGAPRPSSSGSDHCSDAVSITDTSHTITTDGGIVEDKWTPTKSSQTETSTTTSMTPSRLKPTEAVQARYFAATGKCWPGC